jgi:hypothetical protein
VDLCFIAASPDGKKKCKDGSEIDMALPFSREQFFDVFAAYNEALWPYVLLLWATTVIVLFSKRTGLALNALLTFLWIWSAFAYHFAFFSTINPLAWFFGSLFLVQAGLFAWYGVVRHAAEVSPKSSILSVLSWGLTVYALLYPAVGWLEGQEYPRLVTFGLPCPTTILTIGILLRNSARPRVLTVLPLFWAFIGGSGAFLLVVYADWMLIAAGLILLVYIINGMNTEVKYVRRARSRLATRYL